MIKKILILIFNLIAITIFSQIKVSGVVYNEYLETFANAKISGSKGATSSNLDGEFTIELDETKLPQILRISADGYQTEKVTINSFDKKINVILKEGLSIDEVVISASRVPERIIESPVSIERSSLGDIKKSSSDNFYENLANLKEVDVRQSSYNLTFINTRGFADMENSRLIQLVDGVDMVSPSFNYSFGNMQLDSDLDIQSVEILPGAASALYGANAYNGLILINTKNPFDYGGVSARFKSGFTKQEAAGTNPFYDVSTRLAYKFNDGFAAKVNFSYVTSEEWHAVDYRNKQTDTHEVIDTDFDSTTSYDGINLYGDEIIYSGNSTGYNKRTGFLEKNLLNNQTAKNIKFSANLFFRPFKNEKLQIELATKTSKSNNLLQTGATRYVLRDFIFNQNKLEIKGENFYVRGYHTENKSGDSYDLKSLGTAMYEGRYYNLQEYGYPQFSSADWGTQMRNLIDESGMSVKEARKYLDDIVGVPVAGTSKFNSILADAKSRLISEEEFGGKIYDQSKLIHAEGNYNFTSMLNEAIDFQIGGGYRKYSPDTKGTAFSDANSKILVEEYGVYSQLQKKLLDERLKITGSIRYDKSKNFEGNFSPRLAVLYNLGADRNHTVRASYQTGFRNPSLQEQYLYSQIGKGVIGTVKENLDGVSLYFRDGTQDFSVLGKSLIENAVLTRSLYPANGSESQFIKSDYKEVVPESVNTFEVGYRSLVSLSNSTNLNIDFNAFYNIHNHFIFTQDVWISRRGLFYPRGNKKLTAQEKQNIRTAGFEKITEINQLYGASIPNSFVDELIDNDIQLYDMWGLIDFKQGYGNDYLIYTNAKSKVKSYGASLGLSTKVLQNYTVGASYKYAKMDIDNKDYSFEPNFNTPEHSVKIYLGGENIIKNLGFHLDYRWQDKYRWVSAFVKENISARSVLDGQLNYTVPSMKSTFKIGGTNLLGKEYSIASGMGNIGSTYYLSWTINN